MENKFLDTGEEIIFWFKETISKLDEIIKIENEKKLQNSFLDRNRN